MGIHILYVNYNNVMKCFTVLIFLLYLFPTTAQQLKPLKASQKSEWLKDAELLTNGNVAILHSHNTFIDYSRATEDLKRNSYSLSTISLYDEDMALINETKINSISDSILIFNYIEEDVVKKEIVALGVLITPDGGFYAAHWFDYNLNIINKFIYIEDTIAISTYSKFIVNSNHNIMFNGKEFDRNGNLISLYQFQTISYEDQSKNTYIGLNSNTGPYVFLHSSDIDTTLIIESESKGFDPIKIHQSSKNYAVNIKETHLYINTLFRSCRYNYDRSSILKLNLADYSTELLYQDSTENCLDSRPGELGIDLYNDNYIYFINEAESCDEYPRPGFEPNCYVDYSYLRCIDKEGNLRWSKYLGGDANYSECSVVATPDSGCLVLVIRYEHGVNLVTHDPDFKLETDTYYLKFDKNGQVIEPLSTDIAENESLNQRIHLYPNPANDVLKIDVPVFITEPLNLSIFNLKGQLVLSKKINNKPLSIPQLATGHYAYAISNSTKNIKTGKLIVYEN